MTSIFINIEEVIYKAYKIGLKTDTDEKPISKDLLLKMVLSEVPVSTQSRPLESEKPEKVTKPKQTRTIPDDEVRCMAKVSGGQRCKCKKLEDTDFCKFHESKQSFGLWDESETPKSSEVSKTVKSSEVSKTVKSSEVSKTTKPSVQKVTKKVVKETPLENKGYEMIEIYDEDIGTELSYFIDKKNNVYRTDNEKKIGVYDREREEWISGGPMRIEDLSDGGDQDVLEDLLDEY